MNARHTNKNVATVSVATLRPCARNARTHSKRQIRQIAESIRTFGFVNPVLIDEMDGIIAGHGRVEAAKLLGMESVPALRVDHLTDNEKRAYILADNRLAELAGWDRELLALELQALVVDDLDFDVTVTGFDMGEIDLTLAGLEDSDGDQSLPGDDAGEPDPVDDFGADIIKSTVNGVPVTRAGDLWLLGEHRLYCGDALKAESYDALLGDRVAGMVFTDPPYNVPVPGHVSGKGTVKHGDFAMASGEMSRDAFTSFLTTSLGHAAARSVDGAIHFVCMDWRHMGELTAAGSGIYSDLKNLCVWAKTNGGMGSLYRSRHELVFVYKVGTGKHINNVELGRHGRYRSNVWTLPGANAFGKDRDETLALHPTVKPLQLVADAIFDCSNRGDWILDPFGGAGTTILAAERTGRKAALMELDPVYVDVTIARWQAITGKQAIHGTLEMPFDEAAAMRADAVEQTDSGSERVAAETGNIGGPSQGPVGTSAPIPPTAGGRS